MTFIQTSDCTSVTIQSLLFNSTGVNGSDPISEFTITSKINCCGTSYSFVLYPPTPSTVPLNYTVLPTQYNSSWSTFSDGVYSFTITVKYGSGTVKTDSGCILLGCLLKCKVVEFQLLNPTDEAYILYETLKLGSECGDCNCDGMCAVYTELMSKINSIPSLTSCEVVHSCNYPQIDCAICAPRYNYPTTPTLTESTPCGTPNCTTC